MVDESGADARRPAGLPTQYRLVGPLGRGGSATAFVARDTRVGRDVVVKVLDRTDVADDRLEAEVRALGRLRDVPGVVRLEAVGRTATGAPWLVEELASGGSLADRLRRGLLPPDEVVALVAALATTLAAAHRLGVAHGDLSPGNVVLAADGTVLLCDFGVAALVGTASDGAVAATRSFAAPERLAGAAPSSSADVFGLGVLAHVAATGRLPDGTTDALRGAGLPRRLARRLARAVSEDPRRRPSAARLARATGGRRRAGRVGP